MCFIRVAESAGVDAVWRVEPNALSLNDMLVLARFARGEAHAWYGSGTQMEPPLASAERILAAISPPASETR
jgi:hypothetical protein